MGLGSQLKHAWSALTSSQESNPLSSGAQYGITTSQHPPSRPQFRVNSERTIISSIYTRMSIDVAAIKIEHCRVDPETDQYIGAIKSMLNDCLNVEANLDQGGRHFRQDIALTLFGAGVAAIVPVDTTLNPITNGSWDIKTMRVGTVLNWEPEFVRVRLYNQKTGGYEDLRLPKRIVAIVENPFYSVMNEPSSTLQRLIRKLSLLDLVDEQVSSGKMDLIIQLPYVIKSEARRQQANQRRGEIEQQLRGSKYGIAYTDGTEKITQLNRPVENNLLKTVEFLTAKLYSELGITVAIMDGSADEKTMKNYHARTIHPIVQAVVEAMRRSFLTKTARSQRQSIMAFRDPFKLVPISEIAEIADKFTRNEIASSNDIRQAIGWKPSSDPKADQLINSNMPTGTGVGPVVEGRVVERTPVRPALESAPRKSVSVGERQRQLN